jgi:hypothetical protein
MAEPLHRLPLEAELKLQIMRSDVQAAGDLEQLRQVALRVVDMAEMQARLTGAMLRQAYLKPRPFHPALLQGELGPPA